MKKQAVMDGRPDVRKDAMAHCTEQDLAECLRGSLPESKERSVMAHIVQCKCCAEQFAGMAEKAAMATPPPGLQELILCETVKRQPVMKSGHSIVKQARRRGEKAEKGAIGNGRIAAEGRGMRGCSRQGFTGYVFRVAGAAVLALAMLFALPDNLSLGETRQVRQEQRAQMDRGKEKGRTEREEAFEKRQREPGVVGSSLRQATGAMRSGLWNVINFFEEEEEEECIKETDS